MSDKDACKILRREQAEWRKKLIDSGFSDHEDDHGNLSQPDLRTNSFECRDKVLDFFLSLDHLLTHYKEMPSFERKVLTLYASGEFITDIYRKLKCSEKSARMVVKRYKGLIKGIHSLLDNENHLDEQQSRKTMSACG